MREAIAESPRFLQFPASEYASRLRRVRQLMNEARVDALLVSTPADLAYVSGYRSQLSSSHFRPLLALVPIEKDPILLLPDLELGVGEETSPFDDIRAWGQSKRCVANDPFAAVENAARDRGLCSGRIGIEQGSGMRIGLGLDQFSVLKERLPDVDWVDSAPLLWRARQVKSAAEIACLREAQRIADSSYHACLRAAREGISERDLLGVLGSTMMTEGADNPGYQIITSGPDRYKMFNPYASDRRLERGDMVILDIGAVCRGYHSDITRSFFIGSPSSRQREFYESVAAITADTISAVRPGISFEALDAVARECTVGRGYGEFMLHSNGHNVGLEVHEPPFIAPGEDRLLEPGMVITVEPGIYDFSIGAFRLEEMILVTDVGFECLSHAKRDLTVV